MKFYVDKCVHYLLLLFFFVSLKLRNVRREQKHDLAEKENSMNMNFYTMTSMEEIIPFLFSCCLLLLFFYIHKYLRIFKCNEISKSEQVTWKQHQQHIFSYGLKGYFIFWNYKKIHILTI